MLTGSESDALLRAVTQQPDDDLPRLVYADWLDDRGECARAELIRVQVEESRCPDPARAAALAGRARDLLAEHGDRWRAELPCWPGVHAGEFRRGFVASVRADGCAALADACPGVFHESPVEDVSLLHLDPGEATQLTARPELACVRRLDLATRATNAAEVRALHQLLTAAPLAGLRELDLAETAAGDMTARVLARYMTPTALERLDLSRARLSERGAAELAGSPLLGRLRHLRLRHNPVGNAGALAVAAAGAALAALEQLDLAHVGLTDGGGAALAAGLNLPRLRELDLGDNALGDAAAQALAGCAALGGLEALVLRDNHVTSRGAAALAGSMHLARLARLDLSANQIRADGALALTGSAALSGLRDLQLGMNPVGRDADAAVRGRFPRP